MIKVNKGKVEIEGTEARVVDEIMCLTKSFVERVLIPRWGSKENARTELNKMMDEVFSKVED